MKLTYEEALDATRGSAVHPARFPSCFDIVTDSRALRGKEVYLALRGTRFDGHAFTREAYDKGAGGAILERVPDGCGDIPCIIVADTKAAYMALAAAARSHVRGRVIAISGSTGKTTTKGFLEQMLRSQYGKHIAATPSNENNEIGVSKLLLSVRPDDAFVIVEMGARHYHDLAPLTDMARPHVAILTNIGEAHLEIMGSLENVAQTKWEIFKNGAQAVLNWSDGVSRERCSSLKREPHWFIGANCSGRKDRPRRLTALTRTSLSAYRNDACERVPTEAKLPGDHNLSNIAAAAACAAEVGMPLRSIARAIPTLQLPPGRYEVIAIDGRARIIYDGYNASMSGTIATLDAFADECGRRIAVLSSMAELGPEASQMHAVVGAHLGKVGVTIVLVGGEFADDLARGARQAGIPRGNVIPFASNAQAVCWLRANTGAGDVVLVKGSRKYRLEEVVEALRADA
ncbi:MAG: UDP-N-acetylmuramoyl-tripeptide--D-alanyl-D-alanine ligase [Candidatus Eremiobacteraeota bacterium]|nr:UDP-N-acetylmuramoyl-tripeptide--D-alanyl-D-alanine ligase [Candidatus Eremiobacteraeota bacterium]